MRLLINRLYLSQNESVDEPVRLELIRQANRMNCPIECLDAHGLRCEVVQPTMGPSAPVLEVSKQIVNGAITDMQDSPAEASFWERLTQRASSLNGASHIEKKLTSNPRIR